MGTRLGWESFDPTVIDRISKQDRSVVDKSENGHLKCPVEGHDHRLKWRRGDYRLGTESHPDLGVSFRISPTFIYDDPRDNFIAGHKLISQALAGGWGKAETGRLGHENSEDAVSWNVFRSLQEAGELKTAFALFAEALNQEPELILWGRRIRWADSEPCEELKRALDAIEPGLRRQTEPDVILRLQGWGWLLIEAKLGSPAPGIKPRKRQRAWIDAYCGQCPDIFDRVALEAADPSQIPEQLLRNIGVATKLQGSGEVARVVTLVRQRDGLELEKRVARFLKNPRLVEFRRVTWEQLYEALPAMSKLQPLREFMTKKSFSFRRAFEVES